MTKKYTTNNATGDAGQYLVGAVVSSELEWAYRNQPIADIGIDGEIEVIDNEESTGDIVKVQIKSTKEDEVPFSTSIPRNDYEYWKLLSVPVIVCRAVLPEREVYWKHAERGRKTDDSVHYEFTEEDILSADSADSISEFAREASFNIFGGLWHVVRKELEGIAERVPHPQQPTGIANPEKIYEEAEEAAELYEAVKTLEEHFEALAEDAPQEDFETASGLVGEVVRKARLQGRRYEH
jgi:hypothetical protein